jgi:uncharacterized glyoxalase superfamily protein PhnB
LFYQSAFGAVQMKTYHLHNNELLAIDLEIGGRLIAVCGSNPHREADPLRGGPFFLKEKGTGSTIFRLEVNHVSAVLKAAIAAGASVRERIAIAEDGHRTAAIFDPFGYIWGLHEKRMASKQVA